MRLDVALMHHRRPELALDHDIRFAEAALHVAALELHPVGDVVRKRLVQLRRARRNRLIDAGHRRQDVVDHLDSICRLARDVERCRGHGRNRMAVVQHLVARQHAVAHVAEVERRLSAEKHLRGIGRDVARRHHRLHAGQRLGRRRVDRHDARVRVRAAQHRAVQQAGQADIGAVGGAARDFVDAVVAHRPRPDIFEFTIAHV